MLMLLLIWLAVGIGLIVIQMRRGSAGLPLAYFLGLSLIHVPGALLYLGSVEMDSTAAITKVGFEQTIIGMVAFMVGVFAAKLVSRSAQYSKLEYGQYLTSQNVRLLNRIAVFYIIFGGFVYFVLMRISGGIPSITAILSSLGSLLVVGLCLRIWAAREERKPFKIWSTIALLPLLPLATAVQSSFIGFATNWVLVIVCFLFAQSKRPLRYILLAPAVFFVGLSFWINYGASLGDIRRLVWIEQASISDRLQRIAQVFDQFEWLDLSNFEHRRRIQHRLNQNWFVGLAVERLDSGQVDYALGSTPGNIILSLIPRALWPDKPQVGGGGTIVHDFTGFEVAEGTSFGAGQVLEFFVNFGRLGVIGGFLLYGGLVGSLDSYVTKYLKKGDQKQFLFGFLICLALLQPGWNLREIIVCVAGAAVTAYGLGHFLKRYEHTYAIRRVADSR